jgi:hypothetical protein
MKTSQVVRLLMFVVCFLVSHQLYAGDNHSHTTNTCADMYSCVTHTRLFAHASAHRTTLVHGTPVVYVSIDKRHVPRGSTVWHYYRTVTQHHPISFDTYTRLFYTLNKQGAARLVGKYGWRALKHADVRVPVWSAVHTSPTATATRATPVTRIHTVLSRKSAVTATTPNMRSLIKTSFAHTPILIKIASCESGMVHYRTGGTVLQGRQDPDDTGVMQINKRFHLATAQRMGLNIYNVHDNITYAKYLYKTQGTRPWKASQGCWGTRA